MPLRYASWPIPWIWLNCTASRGRFRQAGILVEVLPLKNFEVLQVDLGAPDVCLEAVDFAGQMARQLGAKVLTSGSFGGKTAFLGVQKKGLR